MQELQEENASDEGGRGTLPGKARRQRSAWERPLWKACSVVAVSEMLRVLFCHLWWHSLDSYYKVKLRFHLSSDFQLSFTYFNYLKEESVTLNDFSILRTQVWPFYKDSIPATVYNLSALPRIHFLKRNSFSLVGADADRQWEWEREEVWISRRAVALQYALGAG